MREAWTYVLSSVSRGLSGAEGLRQYRAGGGAIRTQDWYTLRRTAQAAFQEAEAISVRPRGLPVPPEAFTETDWDYRQNFVSIIEVVGRDRVTGARVTRTITVESDELLTLEEWAEAGLDIMEAEAENYGIENFAIGRMFFYKRAEMR